MKKESQISPMSEAVLAGSLILALMWLNTWIQYSQGSAILFEEFRRGLAITAKTAALSVDGDAHRQLHFADRSAMQSEPYQKLQRHLRRILLSEPDYTYVYTTIQDADKFWFVVDGGDPQSDDFSPLMDEYIDWSDNTALQGAIANKSIVVTDGPYTDEWGTFLSAYAPIVDSQGNFVATLGIDVDLKDYYLRIAPMKVAAIRSWVGGTLVSLVIAFLIWRARRRSGDVLELGAMDD